MLTLDGKLSGIKDSKKPSQKPYVTLGDHKELKGYLLSTKVGCTTFLFHLLT